MAQVINTNIASLNAQRNLNASQSSLQTSLTRLSSGLRINSAKDDAAGLAISERFTTQIRGMDVAMRNANDGISLAQTAEGALGEIGNNLQRIRELAVQSRNATNSVSDREALNAEVQQLKSEIQRVAEQTQFNNTNLLDGSTGSFVFQVGANQGQTITVDGMANANIAQLGSWTSVGSPATAAGVAPVGTGGSTTNGAATLTAANLGAPTNADGFNYDSFDITVGSATVTVAATTGATSAAEGRTAVLANIKSAIDAEGITGLTIDDSVADTLSFSNSSGAAVSITDSVGGELGGDITIAAATTTPGTLGALTGDAFTINGTNIEVGAAADAATRLSDLAAAINASDTGVTATVNNGALELSSADDIVVGGSGSVTAETGLTADTYAAVAGTAQTGFSAGTVLTESDADNMILAMDAALTAVNGSRAQLGAVQNRFESVVANLSTNSENLSASRSRIMDTDFAKETANLTRGQILQQAGTAMLAQANSLPQGVLSLLR